MINKKRIISSVIATVLIIIMILSLLPISYFTRHTGYNRDNFIGLYAENDDSLDMIYVGGSACYVYWEPLRAWHNYGFTSYNYAHDSINPQSIKYYIKEAQNTQNPMLWVIDVRPFQYGEMQEVDGTLYMYRESSVRYGTDGMPYSSQNRKGLIKVDVPNVNERLSYYVDLIKNHSNLPFKIVKFMKNIIIDNDFSVFGYLINVKKNDLKGFYFMEEVKPVVREMQTTKEELPLSETMNGILMDLLDFCDSENLSVLFVVHSYCETEEDKMKYNYMERIIKERGYDFLDTNDYQDEIALDTDFNFYNNNHVNVFGAEKYTDFLAEYIKFHYFLPDRREDEAYSEWDKLYDSFENQTLETKQVILTLYREQMKN